MAQTQLTDVIIPDEFTAYQVENFLVSTALSQSGVVAHNAVIGLSASGRCRELYRTVLG